MTTSDIRVTDEIGGYTIDGFGEWLNSAYSFKGNGSFTRFNMEVAYAAGMERAKSDKAVSVDALEALRDEIRAQAGRREDYQDWDDVEEMLRALISKETGNV